MFSQVRDSETTFFLIWNVEKFILRYLDEVEILDEVDTDDDVDTELEVETLNLNKWLIGYRTS